MSSLSLGSLQSMMPYSNSMTGGPSEMMTMMTSAYAPPPPPPPPSYSLPLSMIPIHTQSVLYPTMQYFPPLNSVFNAPSGAPVTSGLAAGGGGGGGVALYDESGLKLEENECHSADSSDEEGSDYSSAHADMLHLNHPDVMAMMMMMQQQQQQQQQLGSESCSAPPPPLHYEFTLPYQCFPVFPNNTSSSCSSSTTSLLTMNTSTIPVVLTTTTSVDMSANGSGPPPGSPYHLSENVSSLLTDNSSVLFKRTRDEYESNQQHHNHRQHHHPLTDQDQPDTYTMTPSVLPPFSNSLA
jgi:hypothetical protein